MKILALDRSALYFGSAYNLIQWSEYYIAKGHSVSLMLGEDGDFRAEAEKIGVDVIVNELPSSLNKYGKKNLTWWRIPLLMLAWFSYNISLCKDKKFKSYDLVVANNYRTYVYFFVFFCFVKFQGLKSILRYQTSDTPVSTFKKLSPFVFSKIIIHGTQSYAREHFGDKFVIRDNVYSLPNPVDTDKFKLLGSGGAIEFREELDIPNDAFIFISVSYIEPRKGVLELVKVFNELASRNIYLVHVGDAGGHVDYEYEVKSAAGSNVRFLGRRSDIPQLLNNANAFVLYSEYEGMPYVVVEAMACGLPVVASDAGSNREVLQDVGRVVGWGDSEALATALVDTALGNVVKKDCIIEKVKNNYSTMAYFEGLDHIYEVQL